MRLFYLATLLMTTASATIGCTQQTTTSSKPATQKQGCGKAKAEQTTRDLGTLKSGDVVGVKFKLKNVGDGPLMVNGHEAGCACTDVRYVKEPIEAGGETNIEVIFDSRGLSGYQYKTVGIDIDGCESERIKLSITAKIDY